MKSNRELIKFYKEKHRLEPVLFSEPWDGKKDYPIDGIVTPLKIDLRQYCSPTDDQGDTAHCAAFSAAQILESICWRETGRPIQIDAAHIYAKAKEIDKATDSDGTYPEIALKCALELASDLGCGAYEVKKLYCSISDKSTVESIKRAIHKNGLLAAGFMITEDWYGLRKGSSFLDSHKKKSLGGHCVVAAGYFNDSLIVQNSWGKDWGANGFGRISWDVVAKEFVYAAYLERV